MRGLFIVVEGVDGSGKTTVAEHLAKWFREQGREVKLTREPGGTCLGMELRSILLSERGAKLSQTTQALLVTAARRHHVETVIAPALAENKVVICDRFTISTRAYQPDADRLNDLIEIGTWIVKPDLILFLDVEYETASRRIMERQMSEATNHFDRPSKEDFNRRRNIMTDCWKSDLNAMKIWSEQPLSIILETVELYASDLLAETT